MTTDQFMVLSNFMLCFVSVVLAFVTALDIGKDERRFLLSVLSLSVVRKRRRRQRPAAPEVPVTPHLAVVTRVEESDREQLWRKA